MRKEGKGEERRGEERREGFSVYECMNGWMDGSMSESVSQ